MIVRCFFYIKLHREGVRRKAARGAVARNRERGARVDDWELSNGSRRSRNVERGGHEAGGETCVTGAPRGNEEQARTRQNTAWEGDEASNLTNRCYSRI